MSNSTGMMMSNRPSGGSGGAAGGGVSKAPVSSSTPSTGNFKGVMLCNRPFGGTSTGASAASSSASSKPAFSAGIPQTEVGYRPVQKEIKVVREAKNTALQKHKQWLQELQKDKERLKEEQEAIEREKEEKKKRFEESQAQMRAAFLQASLEAAEEKVNNENTRELAVGSNKVKKGPKSAKPMWALTEAKAEEANDMLEEEEAEELLGFADNLDIDTYLEELELKAKLEGAEAVVSRMEDELLSEEKRDEILRKEAEERSARLTADNVRHLSGEVDGAHRLRDDDTMSVAQSIFSEARALKYVHSNRSVAELAKRAAASLNPAREQPPRLSNNNDEYIDDVHGQDSIVNPVIVRHDQERPRLEKKGDVNQLPYLYKNPAI